MRRPTKRAAFAIAVGGAALAAAGVLVSSLASEERFPHDEHAGLFPTCLGCHAGIAANDTTAFVSITPEDCAACHDGEELDPVEWRGFVRAPDNVRFSHADHAEELREEGEPAQDCVACHQTPGAETRMAVERAAVASCMECHAPESESHYDVAAVDCATCHVSLAESDLPGERIAELPKPDNHALADFLRTHGATANTQAADCTVCHARESCERCHLNAGQLEAIAAQPRDARVAALVAGRPGTWPEPPSHDDPDWLRAHGGAAREAIQGCANCHAEEGCAACHGSEPPAVIARLPSAPRGGPAGVLLVSALPAGHTMDFVANHGAAAALGAPDCASCHTERQCQACHDGVGRPGFHPIDFVVRHAPEAFANDLECSACHAREGFCRDCHLTVGLAAELSGSSAFHDAVPDWLIAHGAAARQDMESCVGCHQEETCLRCHSAKTGLRVSPHGPGFDPDRVSGRSTMSCAICHFD